MALPKPPKDFYSLTEIAGAWEWSISDILEYAKQGKLVLCVGFIRERATICEIVYDMDKNEVQKKNIKDILLDGSYPVLPRQLNDHMELHENENEPFIQTVLLYQDSEYFEKNLFLRRFKPFDPHAAPCSSCSDLPCTSCDLPCSSEPLIHTYGYGLEARYGFELNKSFNLSLKITHQEKARLEDELKSLAIGPTVRDDLQTQKISDNDIGNKERGTWLKIIYLLAMKIAEKNKTAFLVKGTPKAVAFESLMKITARELEMVKNLSDEDKLEQINKITYGMSDSTLAKIFSEGEKIINKYFE